MIASSTATTSSIRKWSYFTLSILLNALGNALTVSMNLGSALWTASVVNIANYFKFSLGSMLFSTALFALIVNILLLKKLDWPRIIGNLVFTIPFSILANWFTAIFLKTPLINTTFPFNYLVDFLGVIFIGIAISIYQRLNIVLHPCDDLMQTLRFKYFHGNATLAQLTTFAFPVVALIVMYFLQGGLSAINAGTIFALLLQGKIVDLADRFVFPHLKHQGLENIS